ncbi:two-partner secretion domain-containing protein [Nostoc sp.]|uniref:two-partner secretion domain-containing protein n=1 Tax=Nostoc sp. TaxID=1180 RepID=UPI002FF9CBCB
MNQPYHPQKASIKSILSLCLISTAFSQALPAYAQITPDKTLGAEASQLKQNLIINGVLGDKIDGGAIRGSNLFHSFSEFNIQDGQRVYFANPTGIENILTRVTGGNASNIFGTLGVDGAANLFLINPNGILFGQNARLDVQGSFVGTTANGVQFGNQGIFSATNPKAAPLLTIQPSALWFNQLNQGAAIQNNSIAPAGTDPAGFNASGLRVPDGKSLLLVGGNVSMDRGRLNANGGRVELGGLGEPGTVALGIDGDNLSLIFPENVGQASVSLTNQAGIYVTGLGGGNIAVNARNLEILGGTILTAGIGQGLGTPETVAGDITLNATGEIKVAGGSIVRNLVRLGSQGNGGNIFIDSGSFSLSDGAELNASTSGVGNAGNVTVGAKDAVSLAGGSIFNNVETGGVGNSGGINIRGSSLSLTDGARLQSGIRGTDTDLAAGRGNGGSIDINLTGALTISGTKGELASAIFTDVETGARGNGGNIDISSGSFSLSDGAQLVASTLGQGNAGNVTVGAKNAISLTGNAYIFSTVEAGGVGKGGNIDINAATLSLTDGAQLLTATRGASATQPAGQGDAGNVNVKVTGAVDIVGQKNGFPSAIFSLVDTGTVGNGGNIFIDSGDFSLSDGALLAASTSGVGNAGNVRINAKDAITVSRTNQETGLSSALFTFTDSNSQGKGGDININTNIFRLSDGALLDARTRNNQKGGDITVNANVFETLNGAQLTTTTSNNGRAGKITVNADDKLIINGSDSNYSDRITNFPDNVANIGANSGLFVSSTGSGITGDIEINSPKITLDNQGKLNAESASGNGGNINVNSDLLLLRRGAQISTSAATEKLGGNGGNINLNSKFIVAVPEENSDISANAFTGTGGNIQINSQGIFGIESRPKVTEESDITASSELGVSGVTNINTPDNSSIQNSFTGLSPNVIDTNALIANSCISRGIKRQENSFTITGSGALRYTPGDVLTSAYTTGDVRNVEPTPRPWKKGDPIIEPQGLYRLPNGQLILSRSCSK